MGGTNRRSNTGPGTGYDDAAPAWLDACNIVSTEPATRALHSMPCGGGNIALNVWTTRESLLFYIASPDSWNGQTQVKMGRVRVTFSPNPFAAELRQERLARVMAAMD